MGAVRGMPQSMVAATPKAWQMTTPPMTGKVRRLPTVHPVEVGPVERVPADVGGRAQVKGSLRRTAHPATRPPGLIPPRLVMRQSPVPPARQRGNVLAEGGGEAQPAARGRMARVPT